MIKNKYNKLTTINLESGEICVVKEISSLDDGYTKRCIENIFSKNGVVSTEGAETVIKEVVKSGGEKFLSKASSAVGKIFSSLGGSISSFANSASEKVIRPFVKFATGTKTGQMVMIGAGILGAGAAAIAISKSVGRKKRVSEDLKTLKEEDDVVALEEELNRLEKELKKAAEKGDNRKIKDTLFLIKKFSKKIDKLTKKLEKNK